MMGICVHALGVTLHNIPSFSFATSWAHDAHTTHTINNHSVLAHKRGTPSTLSHLLPFTLSSLTNTSYTLTHWNTHHEGWEGTLGGGGHVEGGTPEYYFGKS